MAQPEAQLPVGNPGLIAGVAENFSFHASPESFLASRITKYHSLNPQHSRQRTVVRARILNRDVAIISSHAQALQILSADSSNHVDGEEAHFAAGATYDKLMAPFFPPPNLLLSDGCPHARMRERWDPVMGNLGAAHSEFRQVARQWFSELPLATEIQLYRTMKYMSWRLILVPTLGVSPGGDEAREIERLQEDVLRGQFSVLPVSINTGVWQSARSKGIEAREKLQHIFRERLATRRPQWLPADFVEKNQEEVVNHLIMATSSLAVKSLASLLTALFLNYYLYEKTTGKPLPKGNNLEPLLAETMRLSPPLVGIMRRVTKPTTLPSPGPGAPDTLLPTGWDAWIYLAGANRDPDAFGSTSNTFDPARYAAAAATSSSPSTGAPVPAPLALGDGPKQCLGRDVVKACCIAVLEVCQALEVKMDGVAPRPGVQAWLGWREAGAEAWARDMKQLPTQHPVEPVIVQFSRGYIESRKSYER